MSRPRDLADKANSPGAEEALALVHEGWNHLQLQRPLAAWASWQCALRVHPEFPAAVSALETLEHAAELPAVARTPLRFRQPVDAETRSRWDQQFRGRDLTDLGEAGKAFAALVAFDRSDSAAWYNHALCAAWQGYNAEAIQSLDQVVRLLAETAFEDAESCWRLAEILRQGAGAEPLADDLRFSWALSWDPAKTRNLVARCPELHELPPIQTPGAGDASVPDAKLFEWLDKPMPAPSPTLTFGDLPILRASVIATDRTLRLSSPSPETMEPLADDLLEVAGLEASSIRREASPLPLPLLDAAVWTIRQPQGLDPEAQARLTRDAVEYYYENTWIHRPRKGLEDQSPLDLARRAASGNAIARARLTAVVKVREQLAARVRTAFLYQGYPFDRLRKRLGLPLDDQASTDADDPSCMSERDLAALDPKGLSAEALVGAFESATTLRNDQLASRFAAELGARAPETTQGLASPQIYATLIREAMRVGEPEQALAWVKKARESGDLEEKRTYGIWEAEIFVRMGNPDAAVDAYQATLTDTAMSQNQLLDAAEDLLSHGYPEHAAAFLALGIESAEAVNDRAAISRAHELEERLGMEQI